MTADESGDPWSVTEKSLRAHMRSLRAEDAPAAVATIAAVEGTAYRRPGAKMLVPAGEGNIGAVTAGCLEGPVVQLATEVIEAGQSRLDVFDLTENDSGTWGWGLGCNGVIDLLVEPLDASWDRPLRTLADGDPTTVATVVKSDDGPPVGSRAVIDGDGRHDAVPERPAIPASLLDAAESAVTAVSGTGKTRCVDVDDGQTTLLVDSLEPIPQLLLFGSQNDITPLTRLAAQAGFRTTVHSPRGAVDDSSFPHADTVTTGHPTAIDDSVDVDDQTYAVVMSHNLVDDRLALETLLEATDVPYIGLMGPRERFEEIRAAFADDGDPLTQSALDRIATPVGLDLGGGEPVEIALSIVSEVLAVSNGRAGGRLRDQSGPIHARGPDSPQ